MTEGVDCWLEGRPGWVGRRSIDGEGKQSRERAKAGGRRDGEEVSEGREGERGRGSWRRDVGQD